MTKLVCSVYDIKAEVFSQPFLAINKATAVRDFEAACIDMNSVIGKFPNDYELWIVSMWDEVKGEYDSSFVREFIGRGSAFVKE